ncbi:MAG: rhodanese-like domain-containing protein [Pseudomonadales bacterium]
MEFEHPEYLVDTDWLATHMNDEDVRIVDVTGMLTSKLINRAEEQCFNKGHIRGSVFFDVPAGKGVLSDQNAKLPWSWPSPAQFEATMGEYGVRNDSHVIIVAKTPRADIDSGTMWCTRAWWTMHHFGVRCSILLGGIEKWEDEGREMTTEVKKPTSTSFTASEHYTKGLASKEDVLASINEESICLVDALSENSFEGDEAGYGPRKGHIEGAVNVPFRALMDSETAHFKDADAIGDALKELTSQASVITYCGGAIAATVNAFALKLVGYNNVSVYDASLMEWAADESLPMVDRSEE